MLSKNTCMKIVKICFLNFSSAILLKFIFLFKMRSKTIYISSGINQTKCSFDWNLNINLIAYASSNHIILYNPEDKIVVGCSEESHGEHIAGVWWATGVLGPKYFLLSTATDGSTKVWSYNKEESCQNTVITNSLKHVFTIGGHNGNASCGDIIGIGEHKTWAVRVITAGQDGTLRGWIVDVNSKSCIDTWEASLPGRSLALSVQLLPLPQYWFENDKKYESEVLVAYGGDDGKVHLMGPWGSKCDNMKKLMELSGHEDWVTALHYTIKESSLLLCSGCKAGGIRLWQLNMEWSQNNQEIKPANRKPPILGMRVHTAPLMFDDDAAVLKVRCESAWRGHEGLISSLRFQENTNRPSLLSCALTEDRTVAVWQQSSSEADVWSDEARLGEVGGNREGFFLARIDLARENIAAVGYQGGLHMWEKPSSGLAWHQRAATTGHAESVNDVKAHHNGKWILTLSEDRTARIHAQTQNNSIWAEVARPQVHGFDVQAASWFGGESGEGGYLSGVGGYVSGSAGESVLRAFKPTRAFMRARGILDSCIDQQESGFCESAEVPSLGLSNKESEGSVFSSNNESVLPQLDSVSEDVLLSGTLWPEKAKLYGHGHGVAAVAAAADVVASSCRAQNLHDAAIIIWDLSNWRIMCTILHHRLTVTRLSLLSDGQWLLSASRDRTWAVFRRKEQNFLLVFSSDALAKGSGQHSRVLWGCAWLEGSQEDTDTPPAFVTASRDKTVVLWHPTYLDGQWRWSAEWKRTESSEVTALAAKRLDGEAAWAIALGRYDGIVISLILRRQGKEWATSEEVTTTTRHWKAVRGVDFLKANPLELASVSDDHSLHLHRIEDISTLKY